ncbi:MAG: S1 RNA-binding domain-containing protein, partial [Patescibacteria group bacterium]
KNVSDRYKGGEIVKGKILKSNPFGFFVELDPEIHGLLHISELSKKPGQTAAKMLKPGDEAEFRIISIEPEQHRLGLGLKETDKDTVGAGSPSPKLMEESPSSDDSAGSKDNDKKEAAPEEEPAVEEKTEEKPAEEKKEEPPTEEKKE